MIDIRIASECYADTLLLEKLFERSVNHIKGNGNLKLYFERPEVQDSIIIDITDHDKKVPSGFMELGFKPIAGKDLEHLQANKRDGKNHYLIFIKPALEKFMMACCEQLPGIEIPAFARDLKQLKKKTKSLNIVKDTEITELISLLKRNQPHPITILIDWVNGFLNSLS